MTTTQEDRVRQVLHQAGKPLALHEIQAEIWRIFNHRDSETAISARIREIRRDLELHCGMTIHHVRETSTRHTYTYAAWSAAA